MSDTGTEQPVDDLRAMLVESLAEQEPAAEPAGGIYDSEHSGAGPQSTEAERLWRELRRQQQD